MDLFQGIPQSDIEGVEGVVMALLLDKRIQRTINRLGKKWYPGRPIMPTRENRLRYVVAIIERAIGLAAQVEAQSVRRN